MRQEGESLRWALQARISFNPTSYIRSAQDFWPRMQTASVGSRRKKQRQRMGCHANHDNCHRRYFVLSYVQNILFLQFSNEEMAWPPIYKGWVLWAQQIPIQFCCRILGFLGKRLDFWKKAQHSFTRVGGQRPLRVFSKIHPNLGAFLRGVRDGWPYQNGWIFPKSHPFW